MTDMSQARSSAAKRIDEREVTALHRLIGSEADASNGELARRLLATGKVHVDVEDGAL